MTAAIDTHVLACVLLQDLAAAARCAAARRIVDAASAIGESWPVTLCALLETGWVPRSRCKVDQASMTARMGDRSASE